jgi:hypothetical protein
MRIAQHAIPYSLFPVLCSLFPVPCLSAILLL